MEASYSSRCLHFGGQFIDSLFFKDTIATRLDEIGLANMENVIARKSGEGDTDYKARICADVSRLFGGYSISHVQGRFKAWEVLDRREAAALVAEDKRYLVDETTAAVRFIIPLETGMEALPDDFQPMLKALSEAKAVDRSALISELNRIRLLFFEFFVEAVVRTVKGEDEIWLLETGPARRLYRWMRA